MITQSDTFCSVTIQSNVKCPQVYTCDVIIPLLQIRSNNAILHLLCSEETPASLCAFPQHVNPVSTFCVSLDHLGCTVLALLSCHPRGSGDIRVSLD